MSDPFGISSENHGTQPVVKPKPRPVLLVDAAKELGVDPLDLLTLGVQRKLEICIDLARATAQGLIDGGSNTDRTTPHPVPIYGQHPLLHESLKALHLNDGNWIKVAKVLPPRDGSNSEIDPLAAWTPRGWFDLACPEMVSVDTLWLTADEYKRLVREDHEVAATARKATSMNNSENDSGETASVKRNVGVAAANTDRKSRRRDALLGLFIMLYCNIADEHERKESEGSLISDDGSVNIQQLLLDLQRHLKPRGMQKKDFGAGAVRGHIDDALKAERESELYRRNAENE